MPKTKLRVYQLCRQSFWFHSLSVNEHPVDVRGINDGNGFILAVHGLLTSLTLPGLGSLPFVL
jgi:hypothetical protein